MNSNKQMALNYKKSKQSLDLDEWRNEIKNEKAQFNKYNVLATVPWSSLPNGFNVMEVLIPGGLSK